MIVSKTNVAGSAVVAELPASDLQDIRAVVNGDFSAIYAASLQEKITITFNFATPQDVNYLVIAGSNAARKDRVVIIIGAQVVVDDSELSLPESDTLFYDFAMKSASAVTVEIYGAGQIIIGEIAMGKTYSIPQGYQGGYQKPWTVPNIQTRAGTTIQGAPLSMTYESRNLSTEISVANNLMKDFAGWYEFINFASSNTFFVKEDDVKTHSYVCFNASPQMTKANAQAGSRIGSSAIRFSVYAKSNEVIL